MKLRHHNISELMLSHQKATIECLKKKAAFKRAGVPFFKASCLFEFCVVRELLHRNAKCLLVPHDAVFC